MLSSTGKMTKLNKQINNERQKIAMLPEKRRELDDYGAFMYEVIEQKTNELNALKQQTATEFKSLLTAKLPEIQELSFEIKDDEGNVAINFISVIDDNVRSLFGRFLGKDDGRHIDTDTKQDICIILKFEELESMLTSLKNAPEEQESETNVVKRLRL